MPKPQPTSKQSDLSSALAAFRLNEAELVVYQAAMELGTRPASQIAKHAGLNRPYTYDILSGLAEKGLVLESVRNSVKQYCCTPPDDLVELVNRRETELSLQREQLIRALPMLKQFRRSASSQPGFRYFRGADGMKQLVENSLGVGESTIYAFVNRLYCGEKIESEWPQCSTEFNKRRAQRSICYRGITSAVSTALHAFPDSALTSDEPMTSVRRMPVERDFPLEFLVYGTSVAILPDGDECIGIVVENEAMATAAKCIHDRFWNSLR